MSNDLLSYSELHCMSALCFNDNRLWGTATNENILNSLLSVVSFRHSLIVTHTKIHNWSNLNLQSPVLLNRISCAATTTFCFVTKCSTFKCDTFVHPYRQESRFCRLFNDFQSVNR